MQSLRFWAPSRLGLLVLLLAAALAPAVKGETPTFSQCRPHIEATIQELANKARDGFIPTEVPEFDESPVDAEEAPPAVAEQVLEEEPKQDEAPTEPEEPPIEESPEDEAVDVDEEAEPVAEEEAASEEEVPVEDEWVEEEPAAAEEEPASEEDESEDEEEDSGVDDEDDEDQETEEVEEVEEEEVELDDDEGTDEEEDEDEELGHDDEEEDEDEELGHEDVDEEGVDAVEDEDDGDEEEDVHADEAESDLSAEEADETVDADIDLEGVEEESEEEKDKVVVPEPEVAAAEPEPEATAEPEPEVSVEAEPAVAAETEAKEAEQEATEPEVAETEVPAPDEAEEEKVKPSEPVEPEMETSEPKKTTPPTPIQLSFTDKVIDAIFGGVSTEPRDPKWAKPWQTHKVLVEPEPVQDAPVEEGGFFSRNMNKFVGLVFGQAEDDKRDPKWAQPWQTHKSLPETPKEEKEEAPVEKVKTSGGFTHSIVRVFFGDPDEGLEPEQERDPKWAKPWQTHKELKEEAPSKAPEEKKKVETPETVIRDPKWAEPWQTHKDKEKAPPAEEEPKDKKEVTSGGFIHSFISLFFGAPKTERDPKWAEPWHSHREEEKSIEEPKPVEPDLGKTKRDPKWAKPWQTHREGEEAEKPKDAPKPEMPKVERDPKWAQPWQTHRAAEEKPVEAPKPVMPKVERDPKWAYPWQMHKQLEEQAKAGIPIKPPKPAGAKEAEPEPKQPEEAEPEPEQAEKAEPEPEPAAEDFPSPEVAHRVKEETKVVGDQGPDSAEATKQPVLEEVEEEEVFVIEEEEDPEQIIVVPAIRSRDHVETILGLDEASKGADARIAPVADAVLKDLKDVYDNAIKPLEVLYKYQDISNRHVADAEIFGTPMVLLLGPYSTGKSSFINYLLGTEYTRSALKTGLPPSHGVFRILQYGEEEHELTGTDISANHAFSSLQKFGQNFIDQLSGKVLTNPLLKKVTIVETPGVLEMRRPNERLYPLNDVLQWFIDRADLILVMFDYTKLDAGYEMEAIFDQLKGREAQTRILLNKADQVPPEELIKVQGSLFWNLSPLLGVASPPTVYAGSFSSTPYKVSSPIKLFKAQEEALLSDIANAINSKVDNRIAIARRHAVRVRNHAHMVDSYLATYYKNKGFLTSKHKLSEDIIENPHAYNIYEGMSLLTNVSRYDLPDPEVYRDFFRIHNLYDFPTLKETCSYLRGCPLSKIDTAISTDLPSLLSRFHRLASAAGMPQYTHIPSPMPPMPSASRAAPPPPSTTS